MSGSLLVAPLGITTLVVYGPVVYGVLNNNDYQLSETEYQIQLVPSTDVPVAEVPVASTALKQCLLDTGALLAADVTELNCRDRALTSLMGLGYFPNISQLDLSNNQLQNVFDLAYLPKLQNVNLSENNLPCSQIDALPDTLVAITDSECSNPVLSDISWADPQIQGCIEGIYGETMSTRSIAIRSLNCKGLTGNVDLSGIEQLYELEVLRLSGVEGQHFQADLTPVTAIPRLRALELSGLEADITPLANLRLLQNISIVDSYVQGAEAMAEWDMLTRLQLVSVQTDFPTATLSNRLNNFQEITLSNMALTQVHDFQAPYLNGLDLSLNQLTQLPEQQYPLLTTLDLSSNLIDDVGQLQPYLANLLDLNLSDNRIVSGFFETLSTPVAQEYLIPNILNFSGDEFETDYLDVRLDGNHQLDCDEGDLLQEVGVGLIRLPNHCL